MARETARTVCEYEISYSVCDIRGCTADAGCFGCVPVKLVMISVEYSIGLATVFLKIPSFGCIAIEFDFNIGPLVCYE